MQHIPGQITLEILKRDLYKRDIQPVCKQLSVLYNVSYFVYEATMYYQFDGIRDKLTMFLEYYYFNNFINII